MKRNSLTNIFHIYINIIVTQSKVKTGRKRFSIEFAADILIFVAAGFSYKRDMFHTV